MPTNLDVFMNGYIDAALTTGYTNGDVPLDCYYTVEDVPICPDSLQKIRNDCEKFLRFANSLVDRWYRGAGMHFWYTRNGHSVEFADGSWGEYVNALSAIAKTFGECSLYVGDDGKIHLFNA